MNKLIRWMPMILSLSLLASGCQSGGEPAFEIRDISIETLFEKLDNKESFVLTAEREGCEFCKALNEYIEHTGMEHPGIEVYRINTTELNLYKANQDDKTLISSTPEGQEFLEHFPYFFYTPAIYQILDGEPVYSGIGYDEARHTVSTWDVDSPIEWNKARPVEVWEFLQEVDEASQKASGLSESEGAETSK